MKKLTMIAALCLLTLGGYLFIWPELNKSACGSNDLKISSNQINLRDRAHVQISMGNRYGKKLNRFKKRLKGADNSVFYKKKKSRPWLSRLTSHFKNKKSAKSAYKYLRRKWKSNTKRQYQVIQNGNQVSLYSNHRLTPQCFVEVVEAQSGRQAPVVAKAAKKKKTKIKKRKSVAKKRTKKKRRKRKSRKVAGKRKKRLVSKTRTRKRK